MKVELKHVAVVWVQIAHTPLLIFGDTGTPVRVISPPILQHEADEIDDISEEGKTDEANADCIASRKGTVLGQEGEGGDEATEIAESDLPTGSNGTTQVPSH